MYLFDVGWASILVINFGGGSCSNRKRGRKWEIIW